MAVAVKAIGESSEEAFRFIEAKFGEENGLYYMRARYYSPEMGRFISEDPIGLAGGINMYAYVGNNPVNLTDPFGLDSPIGPIDFPGKNKNKNTKGAFEYVYDYYKKEGPCKYYCKIATIMPCFGTGVAVGVIAKYPPVGTATAYACKATGIMICNSLCPSDETEKPCSDFTLDPEITLIIQTGG